MARHKGTNEQVALKVMLPKVAANQRDVNWFLREIDNTKSLKHPNVVGLKESGYADEMFFFTMEYCEGGSVVDLMAKRGVTTLPIGEIDRALVDNPDIYYKNAAEFKQALLNS